MGEYSSWVRGLRCSQSGETTSHRALASLSPAGVPWIVDYGIAGQDGDAWREALRSRPWSLWRYRELLPLERFEDRVDLGEGGTPLVPLRRSAPPGVEVLIKEEAGNPSGSFKDRGMTMAVNRAVELGVTGIETASAGNAAMSMCAYAAAAGLPARVGVPQDAPPVISQRCREYGAEVLTSPGTLLDAGKMLMARDDGFFNISTFREPYRVEGKKTMGLEVAEQLGWRAPDWIVYPTGGGTGVVGMFKAFEELERLGILEGRRPRFCAVQMNGCAPFVRAFEAKQPDVELWEGAQTRAWGLRVPKSLAGRLVLSAIYDSSGVAVEVDEERLDPLASRLAAQEGRLFGPEGTASMAAVNDLAGNGTIQPGETVVVFQTGHPANYGLA